LRRRNASKGEKWEGPGGSMLGGEWSKIGFGGWRKFETVVWRGNREKT